MSAGVSDWSLTISRAEDELRGHVGYVARCSCGYASPLQTGEDAFANVTRAARQHLQHWHARKPGDPILDEVGIEVAETKRSGWAWRCHVCDEEGFGLADEAGARLRATDHGRQYRHYREAARAVAAGLSVPINYTVEVPS